MTNFGITFLCEVENWGTKQPERGQFFLKLIVLRKARSRISWSLVAPTRCDPGGNRIVMFGRKQDNRTQT